MAIKKPTENTPAMTWQEIADVMTEDEGIPYSAEQVRSIYRRALIKMRKHILIVKSHTGSIF